MGRNSSKGTLQHASQAPPLSQQQPGGGRQPPLIPTLRGTAPASAVQAFGDEAWRAPEEEEEDDDDDEVPQRGSDDDSGGVGMEYF